MIIDINSNPVIDNCLFYNNESLNRGGAVFVYEDSSPHFINCTFADNHADNVGGAFELEIEGNISLTNCILWGNTAKNEYNQISIWPDNPPVLNMYHCDVEEGIDEITPGHFGDTLNIYNFDPQFVVWEGYPYVILNYSPCMDVGTLNPDYLPVDYERPDRCLCGISRLYNNVIDIGCYEWNPPVGGEELSDVQISSVNIYPNPVQSQSIIELNLENAASVQLSIVDITGRMVYELEAPDMQSGRNLISINADSFPAGLYLCRLKIGNEMITKKIIKH
jgi:hypothetical protein